MLGSETFSIVYQLSKVQPKTRGGVVFEALVFCYQSGVLSELSGYSMLSHIIIIMCPRSYSVLQISIEADTEQNGGEVESNGSLQAPTVIPCSRVVF